MFGALQKTVKESKAESTHRLAQEIIRAEAKKRVAKTERLRQARLAAERDAPVVVPAKKPTARRAKTK